MFPHPKKHSLYLHFFSICLFLLQQVTARGDLKEPRNYWKTVNVLVDDASLDHLEQAFRRDSASFKNYWRGELDQDSIVLDILGPKMGGFFLEVGSHNGFWWSNTVRLELENDWKGICVEGSPNHLWMLSRRKCTVVSALISRNDDTAKFDQREDHTGLAGIVSHETDNKLGARGYGERSVVELPTTTIGRILQDFNAPKVIDYFSLDVEGAEHMVLEGFPFDEYMFKVLTVERPKQRAKDILLKNGYVSMWTPIAHGEEVWVHESTKREVEQVETSSFNH